MRLSAQAHTQTNHTNSSDKHNQSALRQQARTHCCGDARAHEAQRSGWVRSHGGKQRDTMRARRQGMPRMKEKRTNHCGDAHVEQAPLRSVEEPQTICCIF